MRGADPDEDDVTAPSRLWTRFQERRRDHPRRVALVHAGRAWDFATLARAAEDVRSGLRGAGVAEGARIGVALPNGPELAAAVLGSFAHPVAVALLSPRVGRAELAAVSRHAGLSACWTTPEAAADFAEVLGNGAVHTVSVSQGKDIALVSPPPRGPSAVSPWTDVALVKFSSGSTGSPKGITLTEDNVLAEAEQVVRGLALSEGARIVAPVSLSHSYGFDLGLLPMITAGATLDAHEGFVPRRVLRSLTEHGGTVLLGVPAMYRILLRQRSDTPLDGVRLISCTAPLSAAVALEVGRRFGAYPCQHYGSSEAGAVTLMDPGAVPGRPDSVGLPLAGVQVTVEAPDGAALPAGRQGEIVIRGPAVASGYLMGEGHRRGTLEAGRFRSGDRGVLDEGGYLWVRGRLDDLINVGGMKVSPEEVVGVLEAVPEVVEAAAVGWTDDDGEEVVLAVVAVTGSTSEAELLQHCRSELADYKVPRRIVLRDELPRGPTGKVRIRREDLLP